MNVIDIRKEFPVGCWVVKKLDVRSGPTPWMLGQVVGHGSLAKNGGSYIVVDGSTKRGTTTRGLFRADDLERVIIEGPNAARAASLKEGRSDGED